MQIELDDLVASACTVVLDSTANRRGACGAEDRRFDGERRIDEVGVAESESEREQRLARAVEVIVAATGRLVIVHEWELACGTRERDRQPSRGSHVTKQHLGHGLSAHLAR